MKFLFSISPQATLDLINGLFHKSYNLEAYDVGSDSVEFIKFIDEDFNKIIGY
jgi:hypothetical protein